jgi:predicted O-linked N-acetylglucosamine transferase (SPINDLY family)
MSTQDQFQRALQLHRGGNFAGAAALYGELLQAQPEHVDALHMFGLLRHQQGQSDEALDLLGRGLALVPAHAAMLSNRASVRIAAGDACGAQADAEAALRADPRQFGAWFNLGVALYALKRPADAASAFARASALRPQDARALLEWFAAAALGEQSAGLAERTRQPLPPLGGERARALQTARLLEQKGYGNQSAAVLARLRSDLPQDTEVSACLKIEMRYRDAALAEYESRSDAALTLAQGVLADAPSHRGARMLKASLFAARGEIEAALAEYRQLLDNESIDARAHSAYLIELQHDPAASAAEVAAAHRDWARRHIPVVAPPWRRAHRNADARRKLRIGWLSPRFFGGLVGTFFLPALQRFDRGAATHVLYDDGAIEDSINAQLRAAADAWYSVDTLDDAALCQRIRDDEIDVLVELSGHSPGNRLRALAMRPAPVQVSWLDYFHSTGTQAVDFLISDGVLSPPELAANYSERVLTLPSGRLCYTAPADAPDVVERTQPAIRFVSFNRVDKLNDDVLGAWSRILGAVPTSTLRLKARAFDDADHRVRFLERCAQHCMAASRLELQGYGATDEVFAEYSDADIALDPFPFSGCATSCDALWMGVPVITRMGDTMVSRQSASLLTSLGLEELIARDTDDYVRRACGLAHERTRLTRLRAQLRPRMRKQLCDADKHTRELEETLRGAWQNWCENAPSGD